jgi:hypothetical protein
MPLDCTQALRYLATVQRLRHSCQSHGKLDIPAECVVTKRLCVQDMTKFSGPGDPGYDAVVGEILRPVRKLRRAKQPMSSLQTGSA